MCMICLDLLDLKMTIPEAVNNAREFSEVKDENHYDELYKALEELDIDKLDKILDEGKEIETSYNFSRVNRRW